MFRLVTLGRLELTDGDRIILPRRRKELALLAYLARRAPRPVSRTELATLLWGERDEARARQSLRQALSELRQAIGDALTVSAETVRLEGGRVELDVTGFEAAIRAGEPARALSMWEGDFLAGAEDLEHEGWSAWVEQERSSLRGLAAAAFEQLTGAAQSQGDWSGAIATAERWCGMLPQDEAARRRLADLHRSADRPEPLPAPRLGARGLLTPDLVGRSESLARLSAAWTIARQGGSAAVLIEGEEGLGKSRLIREFVRVVEGGSAPGLVLEGRAFDTERDRPWSVLRPLLAALAGSPGLLAAPPAALAIVAGIAPEIRERLPQLPPETGGVTTTDAVLRILGDVAAETPLLLIVDDAPGSDSASLEVLRGLLRRPPPGVLVLLTARPEALGASPLSADWGQVSPQVVRVELSPLDTDDIARMLGSMIPLTSETLRSLAARLERDASGRPGHVERLVAALADEGRLAPGPDGRWSLTEALDERPLPLPPGIRERTLGQIQRLSPDARALAEAASVFEREVEAGGLERVGRIPGDRFAAALGELLSRRILRESRSRERSYEFGTDAMRRAIADSLAPSRREQLRRAAESAWNPRAGPRWGVVAAIAAGLIAAVVWGIWRGRGANLPPGAQIILADVENTTADSALGRALYSAATIGLQGSRLVSVFPRARIRETLGRMGRKGADSVLGEALAREVAQREGLAVVVALGVAQVDSSYVLTSRLVDPADGHDIAATQIRLPHRAELLDGLDRLLAKTRRALGESRGQLRAGAEPLPRVTTSSLEALQAWVAGSEAWTARNPTLAQELWERAVRLDPTFAMAMASLADLWYLNYNDRTKGDEWMKRALAQVDRLTGREQLRLRAQAGQRQGDPVAAATFSRALAEQYPSRDTWYNYGNVLLGQSRCDEAIPAWRKALAFDSLFSNGHINVATCLQLGGRSAEALAEYAAAARGDSMALLRANINHEWGVGLVRAGRIAEAESAYRRMSKTGDPFDRARGFRSLAWLAMFHGKFREAVPYLREAVQLNAAGGSAVSVFRNRIILAEALVTLGDIPGARKQLDSAAVLGKTFAVIPAFMLYLGHAYLRIGRVDAASEVLARTLAAGPSATEVDRNATYALDGAVRLARGNAAGALAAVRLATGPQMEAFRLAIVAEAHGARGPADSALAAAVRLSDTFAFGEESQVEWLRGPLLVARYAEALGDSATARAAYARFLEQWKNGDQDLPDQIAARKALVRLRVGVSR